MKKIIVCIATLDTKGQEMKFVKDMIERRGHKALIVDSGILGKPTIHADITREEVAVAAGTTLDEIKAIGIESKAVEMMTAGLSKVVKDLYQSGRLDGVFSIGGGMGTSIATSAMKELPLGVPKLMVSTKVAQSGTGKEYMGTKDITMVSSVADIAGLNRLTRKIATNAVGAIVGMVETPHAEMIDKPLIVLSMNGTTTPCGSRVMSKLEEDYEVVVFHSIGVGGRALEEFIKNEPVKAVIELGLNEIGNELFGGMASAGPTRLEAAGEKGILQIITPASVDFINFLAPDTVPSRYKNRNLFFHNPQATTVRLNGDELISVAEVMAEKLNRATGRVIILIPSQGFSSWDQRGKSFYDPEADRIFIDSLKKKLRSTIRVFEMGVHINDSQFADAIVEEIRKNASNWEGRDSNHHKDKARI